MRGSFIHRVHKTSLSAFLSLSLFLFPRLSLSLFLSVWCCGRKKAKYDGHSDKFVFVEWRGPRSREARRITGRTGTYFTYLPPPPPEKTTSSREKKTGSPGCEFRVRASTHFLYNCTETFEQTTRGPQENTHFFFRLNRVYMYIRRTTNVARLFSTTKQ